MRGEKDERGLVFPLVTHHPPLANGVTDAAATGAGQEEEED
jgi:hypothetical protein